MPNAPTSHVNAEFSGIAHALRRFAADGGRYVDARSCNDRHRAVKTGATRRLRVQRGVAACQIAKTKSARNRNSAHNRFARVSLPGKSGGRGRRIYQYVRQARG